MKKHLKVNRKILLLVVIYLFFHIASCFIVTGHVALRRHRTVVKHEVAYLVHLQKSAKTIISETRFSLTKFIQKASRFFIVLFFFTVITIVVYFFSSKSSSIGDPPYLRFCVMRI